ncbi:hypothetical protein BX616_007034 [Lobosporangium transversale]|nr:hypothetical protein BX616_007034 [Lobosporangium transversale]
MGANGADFTPAGFNGNHVRTKTESDLVGSSLDVFSKPYHHQQTHHHMHSQQGYHGMTHFGGPQHHHNSHAYSPQHATFPPNFSYGSVPNSNGSSVTNPQDQSSTTPPPIRYLSRGQQQQQPFMSYPSTTQGQSPQSSQTSQQQRHSISPGQYGAGSPAMMMPNSGSNGHIQTHDFNLQMGYHSPVTTSPSTFNGLSGGSPQSSHPQPSHHHHTSLPPTTQGWSDFGYSSYPTGPISDHHEQHNHGSASP